MSAFKDWLLEIANTALTVDTSETGLLREAQSNQWGFFFTQEQIEDLSLKDVIGFLNAVTEIYQSHLSERFNQKLQFIFYCWFDEQASELRFSVVSASHGSLPFGSPIQAMPDVNQLVKHFLSSPYHDGVPLDEFVQEAQIGSGSDVTVRVPPLQIWTKSLP